ncbi:MAG: cation transporter [Elusimicrobia bacterium]|nr:cation transporter [Elusimicrobiota bacterium]MBL0058413.1 cation transporter [Elusimicrobiota bacterium]
MVPKESCLFKETFMAEHGHSHVHGHTHGPVDPSIISTGRGLWAVKLSFWGLMATALIQTVVILFSGSVALLADTIHNFADAASAIPLGFAFLLARRKPTRDFPYGLGRSEDLAGLIIVLLILLSASVAGYESVRRLFHPQPVTHLWAVIAASLVGFIGNEAVAVFRIRVGKEIESAALVADGYHSGADGFTSLAVLLGAIGVKLGFPLADPVIGLLITIAILGIVFQSAKTVFARMLDGVEPEVLDEIDHAARHAAGVRGVTEARARWIGHRLQAEINVAVDPKMSVSEGHAVAKEVHHQLLHHVKSLSGALVHVHPLGELDDDRHRFAPHSHDGLPVHTH